MVEADPAPPAQEEPAAEATQVVEAEFKPVEEDSEEALLLMAQMDTIETMTEKKFDLFKVEMVRVNEAENKLDAKIRVDESETPILFVRLERSDPPQVAGLK